MRDSPCVTLTDDRSTPYNVGVLADPPMARFVNLTPHTVNIVDGPSFPASGQVVRCSTVNLSETVVDGIRLVQQALGPVEWLPEPEPGTFYIVSAMAREAAESLGRVDFLSPGQLVRDSEGVITGCLYLVHSNQLTD